MIANILRASVALAQAEGPARRETNPVKLHNDIAVILNQAAQQASNDCEVRLQIVHVQDSTDTFRDDFEEMIASDTIKQLVEYLQETYGPTEYTMSIFHDKLNPVTGHGVSGGWWGEARWDLVEGGNGQTNVCYKLLGGFSEDPDAAQSRFSGIMVNGGKDFMENQWDALLKSAVDPAIQWDLRDYDDEGRPIIRIVMLITDDGAHTAEATFANNVRNPNREWLRQSGPWSNSTANPYQACDVDASRNLVNNINTEYGNLASGNAAGANLPGDGACWGWNYQKAGALRSLKGSLAFMEYFYGFGEDDEIVGQVECGPLLDGANCEKYWSFTHCCTVWGNTFRRGSCDAGTDHHDRFPSFQECMDFGGSYARCHPSMIDTYGGYTGADDWPMARPKACIINTPEYLAAQSMPPTAEFMVGMQNWNVEIDDIVEYPYADPFSVDCEAHEYPDPSDSRYQEAFERLGIHPIIIAAPPSDKVVVDPGSSYVASYDDSALRMSANNCPGLEHDPYTTYLCNESLYGKWYCYTPLDYPQFYPYPASDPALWAADDATSWWRNRCNTQECADQWWTQCMEVEYKAFLDRFPIETSFEVMSADHIPEVIVSTVTKAIDTAISWITCPSDLPDGSTQWNESLPTSVTDDQCPLPVECCPACVCNCGC